ncbi:MAG: hypothetical protein U0670_15900 [Anaerolineae bacterium]
MTQQPNEEMKILAESENYLIWLEDDDTGETNYHIDLEFVTLHLLKEEWDELVQLIRDATRTKGK